MTDEDVFADMRRRSEELRQATIKSIREAAITARRSFRLAMNDLIENPTADKCRGIAAMGIVQAATMGNLAATLYDIEAGREQFEAGMRQAGQEHAP